MSRSKVIAALREAADALSAAPLSKEEEEWRKADKEVQKLMREARLRLEHVSREVEYLMERVLLIEKDPFKWGHLLEDLRYPARSAGNSIESLRKDLAKAQKVSTV